MLDVLGAKTSVKFSTSTFELRTKWRCEEGVYIITARHESYSGGFYEPSWEEQWLEWDEAERLTNYWLQFLSNTNVLGVYLLIASFFATVIWNVINLLRHRNR